MKKLFVVKNEVKKERNPVRYEVKKEESCQRLPSFHSLTEKLIF